MQFNIHKEAPTYLVNRVNIHKYCSKCNKAIEQHMYYITDQTNKILFLTMCHSCLFSLYLAINNIFPTESLLDGTDSYIRESVYEGAGIPSKVYKHLLRNEKIKAIKALREIHGSYVTAEGETYMHMSLLEAKKQCDKWSEVVKPYLKRT